MTTAKSIARFDPVTTHPVEESERHYREVHFPWAQRMLRERPQVLTYHTNRVLRQYDLRAAWNQRPTAWRFVLLTFEPGRGLELDGDTAELIARDHPNCLRNLRSCPVEETLLLDRRCGQTSLQKYLVELDRAPGVTADEADHRLDVLVDGLLGHLDRAFGARLVRRNRVLGEGATVPVVEEGQRGTGELRPETDKHAYLELYFDDTAWGDELFARTEVRALLRDRCFSTLETYHVEERCGLDRRSTTGAP